MKEIKTVRIQSGFYIGGGVLTTMLREGWVLHSVIQNVVEFGANQGLSDYYVFYRTVNRATKSVSKKGVKK